MERPSGAFLMPAPEYPAGRTIRSDPIAQVSHRFAAVSQRQYQR